MKTTKTYEIKGMTCSHCANAVAAEVGKIEGVTKVAVDLDGGKVTITSKKALEVETVRAAIDEAGYELVT